MLFSFSFLLPHSLPLSFCCFLSLSLYIFLSLSALSHSFCCYLSFALPLTLHLYSSSFRDCSWRCFCSLFARCSVLLFAVFLFSAYVLSYFSTSYIQFCFFILLAGVWLFYSFCVADRFFPLMSFLCVLCVFAYCNLCPIVFSITVLVQVFQFSNILCPFHMLDLSLCRVLSIFEFITFNP